MALSVRLVIGVVALIAVTPSQSAPAPAASEEQVIPLYASGPRALAMLTLGNGPPAPVVFDTGTDENMLTQEYARRLGLKVVGQSPMIDAATGKRSMVPVVALARPKLSGVPVSPARAQRVDYREPDMVGVFGPGSFSGQLVTLELANNRLRVSPFDTGGLAHARATPYRAGLPALNIDVAGVAVNAHLDSGSTLGFALGKGLMSKVKLKSPATIVGQAQSVSGSQDVYGGEIDGDVTIGPLVLHDPKVIFAGNGDGGNVGYDILSKLTLVMDPKGQRSWVLDPADLKGPLDQFAGRFGERSVRVAGAKLTYQRDGRPEYALTYLGGDLFSVPDTGDELQFRRTDGGQVMGFDFITAEGNVFRADRTS